MGWENKKNWRYGHTNNFQIGLRYKPGGFFWRSPCSSLSISTLLLSFMWEINDDEKKNCKRPLQKKSHPRLVSRKWRIIRKKNSHHIQRKKFLVHERVMLYKTWSSDNTERTLPNSGYVSQTARALFKTIYKGFTFGLTSFVCIVIWCSPF